MRVFLATSRSLISTFVALGRGRDDLYPVAQELPDSIARALARLESCTKASPPRKGADEKAAA
jgi:hypothetical protein